MELNGFNSDDYIYLQFNNDYKDYKQGQIIRFSIQELRKLLLNDRISMYDRYFDYTPKENISKKDLLPHQIYKNAIVKENAAINFLRIFKGDVIIINDFIKQKLLSNKDIGFSLASHNLLIENTSILNGLTDDEILYDKTTKQLTGNIDNLAFNISNKDLYRLIKKYNISQIFMPRDYLELYFDLNIGDVLPFTDPAIALLFTDQSYAKLLANTHILEGTKELEQFQSDFSICVGNNLRYFKLNKNIKIKTLEDFKKKELFPNDFNNEIFMKNLGYLYYNNIDKFDLDENGFIRFVHIYDNRTLEDEILKIARRATIDEATIHYKHFKFMKDLENKASSYYWNHQRIYKRAVKENQNLTYIQFMIQNEDKLAEQELNQSRKKDKNFKFRDSNEERKYQATRLVKVLKQIKPSSNK